MREGTLAGELPGGASEEEVMAIAVAHDREPHAMAS
jgi:predicted small metal-binding protein